MIRLIATFLLFGVAAMTGNSQADPVWQDFYKTAEEFLDQDNCTEAAVWLEKGRTRLEQNLDASGMTAAYRDNLDALSSCYLKMGGEAVNRYLNSLHTTLDQLGKKHACYPVCLTNLAKTYQEVHRYEEALPLFQEKLELTEKSDGKKDAEYVKALNDLAALHFADNQFQDALTAYEEALELLQKIVGKDAKPYADGLTNVARTYRAMEQHRDALPLVVDAKDITRNTLGEQSAEYALSLVSLAQVYQALQRYDDALPVYIGAQKILDETHPQYFRCLSALAGLYGEMSSFNEAVPLVLEAMDITEKKWGREHENHIELVSQLAGLYTEMGRYEEALPLYNDVLSKTERLWGKENARYGDRLNELALLYIKMKRYEEALPLCREALENCYKYIGFGHSKYGARLNHLADVYLALDRYDDALLLNVEAVNNAEDYLGTSHPSYADRLRNLAYVYRKKGRYEKALPLSLEAYEITGRVMGKDHSADHQRSLNDLAYLYYAMDQDDKALPLYIEANRGILQQISRVFEVSNEKNKEAFLETLKGRFETYHSFAYSNRYRFYTLNRMLYDNEIRRKGLVLNSTRQTMAAVRQSGDPALIQMYQDWKDIRALLAQQYTGTSGGDIDVDSLETLASQMEEELVLKSNAFASSHTEVNWEDVRESLEPGEAAIEFVHFKHEGTRYSAMILTPESKSPKIVPLFEQGELEALLNNQNVQASSLAINDFYRGTKALKTQAVVDQVGLYDLIWKRIEKHLMGATRIHYVPSGQLHQIAQAAVAHPEGGLLSNRYELHQLSSTRTLVTGSAKPDPVSVCLYGGIEFDGSSVPDEGSSDQDLLAYSPSERSSLMEKFNYLEGTDVEVREIESLFHQNNIPTQLTTGSNASEQHFKSLSGNAPKVIHIATHGFFFPDIDREPNERDRGAAFKFIENPMLRAGLIFAGANYAWQHGSNPFEKEDGILTAYEISNLDLTNTDLVVLSACETGLGEIKGSEGVFGLQRAFKLAGVDYLMMSLWQVPDRETKDFMILFYDLWLGGMGIREAFRETQREMASRYPDEPYKWAAFVLVE